MHIYVILIGGRIIMFHEISRTSMVDQIRRTDATRRNEMKRDEIEVSLFSPDTFLAT